MLEAIPSVVWEEIAPLHTSLIRTEDLLKSLQKEVKDIDQAIKDCSGRVDTITDNFLPNLAQQVTNIAVALAECILDMDMHSHKSSLIIQGLQGDKGEEESVTRAKCTKLAKDIGVADADDTYFSACHRLSHTDENA
jgi:hypothetical protein